MQATQVAHSAQLGVNLRWSDVAEFGLACFVKSNLKKKNVLFYWQLIKQTLLKCL